MSAAAAIAPAAWPADAHALAERLREIRIREDLPNRARVVSWRHGHAPGVASSPPTAGMDEAALAPLVAAGFEIVSVLSPAQALGRVVRARQVDAPAGTAVAALSLNTHGAAIAIVSGTEVIHSRIVEWSLGTPFTGQRGAGSELLDRYLLVSQIAPQLQHDIDLVRPVHGVTVTTVVACGNLPDLRSIAMLLIEEMDLEVETLDSAELLDPGIAPGSLADAVASLQLAAAVASSGENRVPVHAESALATSETSEPPGEQAPKRFWPGARLQSLAASAVFAFCAAWSAIQVAGSSPARPIFPHGIDHILAAAAPAAAGSATGRPELRPEATTGRSDAVAPAAPPSDLASERRDGSLRTRCRASRQPPTDRPELPRCASRFRPSMAS